MRILDKNTDFYDYLQNVYIDKSVTFDRTDSYLLTKDMLCRKLSDREDEPDFVLLQVCNTFWLFYLEVTEREYGWGRAKKYSVHLLYHWRNYAKKRELIKLDVIEFDYAVFSRLIRYDKKLRRNKCEKDKILQSAGTLSREIDTGNYEVDWEANKDVVWKGYVRCVETRTPLLKACGLAEFIDPLDIYLAIEEYFSLEKQSAERTESVGLTDRDRIESHGFDIKSSFRGKNR